MLKTAASMLLIAFALGAAGCGGDEDDDGTPTASEDRPATTQPSAATSDRGTEPVGSADVTLSEFEVRLAKKSFSREGVYRLAVVNDGGRTHALEAEGPNGESETEEIPPGESAELDAYFVSGAYELYCPIGDHRERGMTAKLRVER